MKLSGRASLSPRLTGKLGTTVVVTVLVFSLSVSVYHIWVHKAPLLPTLLGQGELMAFSILFGLGGYYALTNVEDSRERNIVGVWAGAGYALAGLASGGYAFHQHLTPEAVLGFDAILFQAVFVALVGGTAGVFLGLEKAKRARTIANLDETTRDLKATKADIRTEKQRFESLFQNAPTAIADLQYTGGGPTVDRGNSALEDLLEFTSAEVKGENLFEVVPLEEDVTEEEVATHLKENEIYEGEVTVDRSAERSHYKLRVNPYEVGKEGERAFALYTNVTELRKTQQELEETVDQLRESNERLEQFAYAASHDLKEPLRMVSNYLDLLDSRYSDDLDPEAEAFMEFAIDGADRMRAMIDSLLDYSRVATRGDPMRPTDAEAVLNDVLTDLQSRIEETDGRVTIQELPTVTVDPDQLAQVFRNLISNALKYSGNEPPQVDVGVERIEGAWQFTVADQGIGIDPSQRDQVFEVFQTLRPAGKGAGSGIGLALCQRIVERHGGEIWVESTTNEGATFCFTIPMTDEQQAEPIVQSSTFSDRK